MISGFFPVKKLRRNGKCLLLGVILLVGAVAVYCELLFKTWSRVTNAESSSWYRIAKTSEHGEIGDSRGVLKEQSKYLTDSAAWSSNYSPPTWKAEYKGRANLHVFDDWCGRSTAQLRKNLHFPLYPHIRTTVRKLAVRPQWTNYGLRIFGYLHPYADAEYVFAVSSGDNSEFWISSDDTPHNLELLAWVGKTGTEWTAPGEFEKYASQISGPVRLSAQRRYFFEVIHKQDGRGTDHVEVAWQLLGHSPGFTIIDSEHISLYVDESTFLMSDVTHIPQTLASHTVAPRKELTADILKEDPRDEFHRVPLINKSFLQNVLPDCSYKPSYIIKDFLLHRYQGLQFVHLSYVYPNDYTRLTHMETEGSCFYRKTKFGFSGYMKLDPPESNEKDILGGDSPWEKSVNEKLEMDAYQSRGEIEPDYGDDLEDYAQKVRRRLLSLPSKDTMNSTDRGVDIEVQRTTGEHNVVQTHPEKPYRPLQSEPKRASRHDMQQTKSPTRTTDQLKAKREAVFARRKNGTSPMTVGIDSHKAKEEPVLSSELSIAKNPLHERSQKMNHLKTPRLPSLHDMPLKDTVRMAKEQGFLTGRVELQTTTKKRFTSPKNDADRRSVQFNQKQTDITKPYKETPVPIYDTGVNWRQTFQVDWVDHQGQRSDLIDLNCNISGNMLLHLSEALPLVNAFMKEFNKKHHGSFTLVRVVNVVKRGDGLQGSRYLLELELKDVHGRLLRLTQYVYALIQRPSLHNRKGGVRDPPMKMVLCNPVGFRWNPAATVNFIVPVKNQARWVQTLITDMERLFIQTGDTNFNLIIADYNSTDMDVRKALKTSSLPRYQYVKLSGSFERAAGLQAGVDLINDDHSIVFLCDLHIGFPASIIDTTRKHCVEGYMAFAPILMRLDCGATPQDAKGYWEVNGFGLLGIYKSDLMAIGGMNTKEYTYRWGGEDWELLDRILQGGLEVERIYLRNFFHRYHSKRGMWNHRTKSSHS